MKCLRCRNKKPIFVIGYVQLYQCERCGTKWSRLYDYDNRTWKYVEGNFLEPQHPVVVILSGTHDEYLQARERIKDVTGLEDRDFIRLMDDSIHIIMNLAPRPFIYLVGTYYEHDELLSDDRVIYILNRGETHGQSIDG